MTAPSKEELSKVYNPKLVEKTGYQTWMKNGYFKEVIHRDHLALLEESL